MMDFIRKAYCLLFLINKIIYKFLNLAIKWQMFHQLNIDDSYMSMIWITKKLVFYCYVDLFNSALFLASFSTIRAGVICD